ncbi:MAG: BNR-4 repeat-containing protein [Bacteroidota bacterium]
MIITGWVTSQGNIEAARLNLETDSIQTSELYFRLEQDDHDNPAFVHAANNEILAMYTRHSRKDLFINRLNDYTSDFEFSGAQLIHPFSDAELKKFPWETMSYANPYRLADEGNRIYCFGRWTGFKPNMMWSDDNGTTWSKSRVFITNYPFESNNRPYVKYASDGESKIHFVFTDGHPRDEPTNSVYYACYEKDAFYKASGELICTMGDIPFEPKDASVVYTSNPVDGRAWIADIGQNETGNPVILYTRSPEETNHEYWYARYTDKWWVNRKICNSGTWFPQTPGGKEEREKHYFGGLTIHPGNPGVIYLSRQINDVFEIERWETIDMGKTWKSEPITENSRYDNVRPYIPRGLEAVADEVVFWMENQKYLHYTNYESSIKYYIRQ